MARSIVTKKYEQLKTKIYNRTLKNLGYSRQGSRFWYVKNSVEFYIFFQRSRWVSTDICKFTINYGRYLVDADLEFQSSPKRICDKSGSEIWLEIDEFMEIDKLAQQVEDIIRQDILPELREK